MSNYGISPSTTWNGASISGVENLALNVQSAPPPSGHLYWRLLLTQATNVYGVVLSEVEFYDGDGNLLVGGTRTAFSETADHPAENLFDGDDWTEWQNDYDYWADPGNPATHATEWITVQFPSPVTVGGVRLCAEHWLQTITSQHLPPHQVEIQYSDDGSTWTTAGPTFVPGALPWSSGSFPAGAWYASNGPNSGNWRAHMFPVTAPAAGWFYEWRINITEVTRPNLGPVTAQEVVFAGSGGANEAQPDFWATCSSGAGLAWGFSHDGYSWPYSLYDGDSETGWQSSYTWNASPKPMFVGYCFKEPRKITQVRITNVPAYWRSGDITAFSLEGSNDGGKTWTTVGSWTTSADWGDEETRTFDV